MVLTLSSSEKLNASRTSTLTLFDARLTSLASSRAINITLKGCEPVLPRATKMMLMVPKGGLEEAFLGVRKEAFCGRI